MRLAANDGLRTLRNGLIALGLLAACAGGTSAQVVFDGNVLYNNNGSGTLAGQFIGTISAGPVCAIGLTPAQLGTVTYVNNVYGDPLLPNAPYQPNVVPDFRPAIGSPAYNQAVQLPSDGFFENVCYAGAIGPNPGDNWVKVSTWGNNPSPADLAVPNVGWAYYDTTGGNRQDLHIGAMPDPRPLAVYPNVNLYDSQTWAPDSNYLIRGQLRVKDQASLIIRAGVVIFEERATLGTIVVERGGQIFAVGTEDNPIIITSDDPPGSMATGAGGGIILNGRARVNVVNSCAGDSASTEGGLVGYYGGDDDDDNSGTLRYVRVEFAGKEITPNNELNSFTFCGVGRGTQIEYLEAYRGADDGFEVFGGVTEAKHLLLIDGTDDGFDWQLGYRGRAQFVIIRQSPRFAPSGTQNGDKGIEADNNEFNFEASVCSGYSNPIVSNFTMVGDKRIGPTFPGPVAGVNLRRGTAGQVVNSIIFNFKTGALKFDDNATWEHHCAAPPAAPTTCSLLGVPIASGNVFVVRGAPNPFQHQVDFSFALPLEGDVRLEIFSAAGQRVATLAAGRLPAGPHHLTWRVDRQTPGGVYFYKVLANGAESTGKIVRVN